MLQKIIQRVREWTRRLREAWSSEAVLNGPCEPKAENDNNEISDGGNGSSDKTAAKKQGQSGSDDTTSPDGIGGPQKKQNYTDTQETSNSTKKNGKERKGKLKEPVKKGGQRKGKNSGGPKPSPPQEPPLSRPELVCRKSSDSWEWEVVLCADDECKIENVQHNGERLDAVKSEYHLQRFNGLLTIAFENGTEDKIPLFDGEQPLIFKLRKEWNGDGRKVGGIKKGHFIVIAPNEWQRTGRAPVGAGGCADPKFRAHYFYRDGSESEEDIGGFQECKVSLTRSGFELNGERVFDDSEDGDLFVGDVPNLEPSQNIAWVRVGEEKKKGWKGENFKTDKKTLAEILSDRQGRFFIRVYDDNVRLLDSDEFRYLSDLKEICVNGKRYTETTILTPSPTGHQQTRINFIGVNGGIVRPILPDEAPHAKVEEGVIVIEPHPDADAVSCTLKSDTGSVSTTLNLPRIWWCVEQYEDRSSEWRSTPLEMTRKEFRELGERSTIIRLRLPRRMKSVHVGFENELDEKRSREKAGDDILIPLKDFIYHSQITQRLNEDASFKVECDAAELTLIRVFADPAPAIISFTYEPKTIGAGEQATLRWESRNAEAGGVAIDPEIGVVEPSGRLEITLSKTTTYTLRLTASGMDDIMQAVTIAVDTHPSRVGEIPYVKGAGGRWRRGKGFSLDELIAAGLTMSDAAQQPIPIDRRRCTTHRRNIETIKRLVDA